MSTSQSSDSSQQLCNNTVHWQNCKISEELRPQIDEMVLENLHETVTFHDLRRNGANVVSCLASIGHCKEDHEMENGK